jgi:methyl-accepting chemotaxis protein
MRLTIGKKLGFGFFAVLALMAASAIIVSLSVANMNRNLQVVTNCEKLLNGINHAMASLRGYMILGDDKTQEGFFKGERKTAWENMDAGMSDLLENHVSSMNAADAKRIDIIKAKLPPLREAQDSVEKIAQTADNVPAVKLFLQEVAPETEKTLDAVTKLIEAEAANEASADRKQLLKNLADVRGSFAQCLADIRGFLIAGETSFQAEFDKDWQMNQGALAAIEAQSALLMGTQIAAWKELTQHLDSFRPMPQKLFAARLDKNWNQANYLLETEASPKGTAIRDAAEELKESALSDLTAARRTVTVTLASATLLAIVIGGVIAFVLSRRMSSSVRGVLSRVQDVAGGDLRGEAVRVDSSDEIAELSTGFNSMVAALRSILSETSSMTGEVAAASSEIATGAQQQLSTLNQTATSLNEITTTSEEFKATMLEFADRARAVQEAADETTQRTAQGRRLTQESSARIQQVRDNSQTAGKSVLKLSEQMQQIGEITATVNEIAEQTKLLALNASIEAARAGEEGRGFAVVATQVRELANQSKEAARRIELLIGNTQKSMQDVVAKIEDGSRLSSDSVESVQQMAQAFEEIASAIEQTRDAMSQINTGARQQEEGIAELVSSITEIDSGSRESVAAAEQTQKAIVAIDHRLQSLNTSIARFKT